MSPLLEEDVVKVYQAYSQIDFKHKTESYALWGKMMMKLSASFQVV
jgi:hypothetical protein